MGEWITRFAPTPSGYLHPGNAFSFLLTWCMARKNKGKILLRIDDLDSERVRPEYILDIFDSIDWLGLDYDIGPESPDDFFQNWTQQKRLPHYEKEINRLISNPDLIFACECSRAQLRTQEKSGRYPGTCENKNLPPDRPETSLRIKVPEGTIVQFMDYAGGSTIFPIGIETGSFIFRRRDRIPAYFLTSLVDDLQFGVNFIVRGMDLLPSSAAQVYLADKLDFPAFGNSTFLHHPIIVGKDGKKLSKSEGAGSLIKMREVGVSASTIINEFARALGLTGNLPQTTPELLDAFIPGIHGKARHWQGNGTKL